MAPSIMNPETVSSTTLRSRWPVIPWATRVALVVLILGLIVATVPDRYNQILGLALANRADLAQLGVSVGFYTVYSIATEVAIALAFSITALAIIWRKSDDWMTMFVALTLVAYGAAVPPPMHELVTIQHALSLPISFVRDLGVGAYLLFFYLFPDGRFVPRWTRALPIAWAALYLPAIFFLTAPFSPASWPDLLQFLVFLGWFGTGVVAQLHRYARVSDPVQRQQTKWVVYGLTAAVFGNLVIHLPIFIFPSLSQPGLPRLIYLLVHQPFFVFSQILVPLSIGISILRYRLWDIDVLINRTLVFGALTATIVALYILIVGALGTLFQTSGNLLVSLLATGLAAVLFQPLRERLQQSVNRLMYGGWDDPVTVLSQLGRRMEAAIAPEAVLPSLVETVAQTLKLPYVAIELQAIDGTEIAAEFGSRAVDPIRLPLTHQREKVGHLIVSRRGPGELIRPAEFKLLRNIAQQAGAAVHAVQLTAALQRSRQHLVTAREEERRRLRRDLHDGLGPALAALHLQAGVLRRLFRSDADAAEAMVSEFRLEIRAAIDEIRRVVHALRPPVLDQLGLVAAIRARAGQCNRGEGDVANRDPDSSGEYSLHVQVESPEALPPLPAAVEVAAYLIVEEALANVVHHSRANRCLIRLNLNDHLQLEIVDDGVGLPPERSDGVGLLSMRERAAELGGTFAVEPAPGSGTRVRASLPLVQE